MTEFVINGEFLAGKRIGRGAFGEIFEGKCLSTDMPVAVKSESIEAKPPQLKFESRMYKMMAGYVGVPKIYYYGKEGNRSVLVMDLLGPSLEDLFAACKR